MRKSFVMLLLLAVCLQVSGCDLFPVPAASSSGSSTEAPGEPTPAFTTEQTGSAEPEPTVQPSPEPTEEPVPTPTPFIAETPDHAGNNAILFDIYKNKAIADLTGDGKPDRIELIAGKTSSNLSINGKEYAVKKPGLAQLFAITDVKKNDKWLEIVLTQQYDADLADSEKAFSWLYWWDGASLFPMGGLMDVKFDGDWRVSLKPEDVFDGAGQVTCLARTTDFTDIWYMAHYKPETSKRALKEAPYPASLLNEHGKLTVKTCCLLLKSITTKYFQPDGIGMYDPASWPHADGRLPVSPSAADYTVIAQTGEKLSIVAVYGQNWFKLKTDDGYQGWIKVVDGKMQGYWQVMGWTVNDMFSGILIAG